MLETLHNFFFVGVATLFLFESIILFVRSKNNKVRKTMAILELAWGLEYLCALVLMLTMNPPEAYSLFREKVLVVGSFYITIILIFPMQVLIPGWLNWKRMLYLFFPVVLQTVVYYGGMYLLGEHPENMYTYAAVWASLPHFNVWFRFVILLFNLIYIVFILKWLYGYEKKYIQWKNENYADQDYVDISWMRAYDCIMIGIFIFYIGILFLGGRISVMCHCTFVIVSFSYLFYKTLFYESPYPDNFFAAKEDGSSEDCLENENLLTTMEETLNDFSFESRIPVYTEKIKQWLEHDKPYLYNDFKLSDVSRILPLNRSYLSRVFNEGFHHNFSEIVRSYRVEYAKELIVNRPLLSIVKVAELSGFNSDTTFIRAFKQVTGITPSQFKTKQLK